MTSPTRNIGDANVYVGSPLAHMDPNGDGDFSDQDGLFEFATCHEHFHFQHYAEYRLIDAAGKTWKSAKRGFCMLDTDPYNVNNGDGTWNYRNCGSVERDGFQGISDGWADTYVFKLGGQYFVLDGGDGQPVVPRASTASRSRSTRITRPTVRETVRAPRIPRPDSAQLQPYILGQWIPSPLGYRPLSVTPSPSSASSVVAEGPACSLPATGHSIARSSSRRWTSRPPRPAAPSDFVVRWG